MKHLLLVLFLISPYTSFALIKSIVADVTRTMANSNSSYGGCMIAIKQRPSDEGLDCGSSRWLSLGCESNHISPEGAARMRQEADKAFVLGWRAKIWVNDTVKHNGFCTAIRIDVLRPASADSSSSAESSYDDYYDYDDDEFLLPMSDEITDMEF